MSDLNRKAKFSMSNDYYKPGMYLVEFEGNPYYDIAPGVEMPASFVREWAKANKAVEALQDIAHDEWVVWEQAQDEKLYAMTEEDNE